MSGTRARDLRVVDGDTVWARIDCGFGVTIREKLRLRGIDAPEMRTAAGQRSKDFVEERLSQVDYRIVATSRVDLYDRYLADVVYLPGEGDALRVLENGIYLNRELLEGGLATAYR